jgi:hypothetical protein
MALLIEPNGRKTIKTPENGRDFTLDELRRLVGCEYIEVAHLGAQGGAFFVLDEEGKLTGKDYNAEATAMYQANHPWDYIVGNALLCDPGEVR